MKFGYARVSTLKQDLQEQIAILKAQGVEEDCIYSEKFTGTKKSRPQFDELLSQLRKGDELIVAKLDRLGRSTQNILEVVKELQDKGVKVNVLNMGVIDDSATGKLMLTMMSAFAEFERDLIVERMQEGRAFKRKTDKKYKEGRPARKLSDRYLRAIDYKLIQGHSFSEMEKMTGISLATCKRIVKQYKDEVEQGIRADKLGWKKVIDKDAQ